MGLELRYVAACDRCDHTYVLHSREQAESKAALKAVGWRRVVEGNGNELLCSTCFEKLAAASRLRLDGLKRGELQDLRLQRCRFRPGSRACRDCGSYTTYDELVYKPRAKEHPSNLVCIPCAKRYARVVGFNAWLDEPLSVQGGGPFAPGETDTP